MPCKRRSRKRKFQSSSRGHSPAAKIKCCKKKDLNITELPDDILLKIFDNINIWHHNRIRATCQRFRELHNYFLMHKFKAMHELAKKEVAEPNRYKAALLKALYVSTQAFWNWSYVSSFCSHFLQLMRECYKCDFCPAISNVANCLNSFFESVEDFEQENQTFHSYLLYTTTLFRLLMDLTEDCQMFVVENSVNLQVSFELPGKWISYVWRSMKISNENGQRHNHLLVMLAELLIFHKMKISNKLVWEVPSSTYVLGNDMREVKRKPCAYVRIKIFATHKVRQFFRYVLQRSTEHIDLPKDWPMYNFEIDINVVHTGLQNIYINNINKFNPPSLY